MRTQIQLIDLAQEKLSAAQNLLNGEFYTDAYYIGGYSLELYLKASICKTLKIDDLFDFEKVNVRKLPLSDGSRRFSMDNLYKPFKVHDYCQLFILSGLYHEFESKINSDGEFNLSWMVVCSWNEELRYSTERKNKIDVETFLDSLNTIISWLQPYLSSI